MRRPASRVVVSDADPAICGAMAHLVGVAFKTPIVSESIATTVHVQVLGEYQLNSSLMASAMGESFAASAVTNLADVAGVSAFITMRGLSRVPSDEHFIRSVQAPIVCLSRLRSAFSTHKPVPALAAIACSADEAFDHDAVPGLSIVDMADMCSAFAIILANELRN
jgi:hypothetical protein